MYLKRVPKLVQGLSSGTYRIDSPAVYLSFDDGPTAATGQLLDILQAYQAKASFFLLGESIESHPEMLERIIAEGHAIGNHGYAHLDGWKTNKSKYLDNVAKGKALSKSELFRPPYGRMTPAQWQAVRQTERVVMWDVMPGDFDPQVDAQTCVERVCSLSQAGSIIVLHDNAASKATVIEALPQILDYFNKKGLTMEPLDKNVLDQVST